jgi:hypothetical protein
MKDGFLYISYNINYLETCNIIEIGVVPQSMKMQMSTIYKNLKVLSKNKI